MSSHIHAFALVTLAALSACGHSHHSHGSGSAGSQNSVFESEPNDFGDQANYFGAVGPGSYFEIQGSITECCNDNYDGFAFYAVQPVSVFITLNEANVFADLDFGIYIPEADAFVEAWETDNHPEFGVFNFAGPGEFHIVIDSWIGNSAYLLQVDVQPLQFAVLGSDGPGAALSPGSAEIAGAGRAPSDFTLERFGDYRGQVQGPQHLRVELRELPALDNGASELELGEHERPLR